MPYNDVGVCSELGITVRRMWLRETWGAWIPRYKTIIIADGLSEANERCTIAHHLEHALAGHGPCGTGPHADRLREAHLMSQLSISQDDDADRAAARKLLSGIALVPLATRGDLCAEAGKIGVTERLLTLRLADLFGEMSWLVPSKIAG
ncbi:ImmA/IrrE family metallo-endopeptidase [Streptomyces sp. NBC_00433]